jgi:hypothetical protein
MIARRDFLKLMGAGVIAAFVLPNSRALAANIESWTILDVKKIPLYYRNILSLVPEMGFSQSGILQMRVVENGVAAMKDMPVSQTKFNRKFLEIAKRDSTWRFVTDQPIGLAWHSFGDSPEFASRWYPKGTAREYIELGFGDRSVQFVVGDGIPQPGQESLDKKLAIVQAELPDANGNWVSSAHIVNVDRRLFNDGLQYFANAYFSLLRDYGFSDPYSLSILQQLYQPRFNDRPNIQLVGMEIQGYHFDEIKNFPGFQKFANILAVSLAIIKKHKIASPAFNAYGHQELDFDKGDPGKNVIFGMKILIGVYALVSRDQELKDLVFGPFTLGGKRSKANAVASYFYFIEDYYKRTAEPGMIDYWVNFFQIDAIHNLVQNPLIASVNSGT